MKWKKLKQSEECKALERGKQKQGGTRIRDYI